jgi:glycosyltransferase involved in cell wall biosynthesis
MRIALVSTPFLAVPPRDYGGTELVVYELAEGLIEQGHAVTLFATGDSTTRAEKRALYATGQWPPDALADVNHVSWALREIVRDGQYDIVHTHSAVALALTRVVPRLPLVYTIHHAREEHLSEFYTYFRDVQYIAISEEQRRREIRLPHVEVIHHGLDSARYSSTDCPRDYVCFIGRFAREKGPDVAIDVAAEARVPILVAGQTNPPDRAWAERELEGRLSQQHVQFLGSVGDTLKAPLLRDARALLAPISWQEPFGLVLAEAMLSGCPVVAFKQGSVGELVEEGITGFIAHSREHMADIIRPGGVLDSFDRARCRARAVERFSRQRMTADHVELYQAVMARSRSRRARGKQREVMAI